MVTSSKILTVTYGTFSCTLEGFDDPFTTLQMVAEYFRKLAAEDRYFGGVPQVPDAQTLTRIAEKANPKGVATEIGEHGIILRQTGMAADVPAGADTDEMPARQRQDNRDQDDVQDVVEAGSQAPAAPIPDVPAAAAMFVSRRADAPEPADPNAADEGNIAEAEVDEAKSDDTDDDAAGLIVSHASPRLATPSQEAVSETLEKIRANITKAESDIDNQDRADAAATEVEAMEPEAAGSENQDTPVSEAAPEMAKAAEDAEPPVTETAPDQTDVEQADATQDDTAAPLILNQADAIAPEPSETAELETVELEDAGNTEPQPTRTDPDAPEASIEAGDSNSKPAAAVAAEGDDTPSNQVVSDETTAETEDQAAAEEPAHPSSVLSPEEEAELARVLAAAEAEAQELNAAADQEQTQDETPEAQPVTDHAAEQPLSEAQPPETDTDTEARPVPVTDTVTDTDTDTDMDTDMDTAAQTEAAETTQAEANSETGPEADARRKQAAAILQAQSGTKDDKVLERLLETTQSKMDRPEQQRRMNALDQLKAAVAATEAERQGKSGTSLLDRSDDTDEDATDLAAYREDLRQAQNPNRKAARAPRGSVSAPVTPAPLILVSEQLIKVPAANVPDTEVATAAPVDPATQSSGNLALKQEPAPTPETADAVQDEDDSIQGLPADVFADATSFADFAERIGAFELTDLLEAAAAYTSIIEDKPRFSRAQVMSKIAKLNHGDSYSKEAGLRAFGKLLREGKILRVQDGQFGISKASRFSIATRYNED